MHPILVWALKNWKVVAGAGVIAFLLGNIWFLRNQNQNLQEQLVAQRLATDSVIAVNDTTRERDLETIGDLLRYFERRIVQTELERDALDEELQQISRVRTNLQTRIDSLRSEVQSDTSYFETETAYAEFNFYEEPYTIDARVAIPPPPEPADLDIGITLGEIPLGIRIGCGTGEEVNRATIGVTAPSWAEVEINDVRQDPIVCNPHLAVPDRGWLDRNRGKLGIFVGVLGTVGTVLLTR